MGWSSEMQRNGPESLSPGIMGGYVFENATMSVEDKIRAFLIAKFLQSGLYSVSLNRNQWNG